MPRSPLQGILLGTADATPQPHRGQSATFVQYKDYRFLVDIGSGALQKLVEMGESPSDLHAVFLTHAHLDHLGDLLFLFFGIGAQTIPRQFPLALYASEQTLTHVRAMYDAFAPWTARDPDAVTWNPIAAHQHLDIGGLRLRTSNVHHTESSIAYQWETPDGHRLAIPGDTGVCAPLLEFVRDVDTLILECGSDPAHPVPTHLTPEQVLEVLNYAQPNQAYIVHCASTLNREELRAYFKSSYDGTLYLAEDCDRFGVPCAIEPSST